MDIYLVQILREFENHIHPWIEDLGILVPTPAVVTGHAREREGKRDGGRGAGQGTTLLTGNETLRQVAVTPVGIGGSGWG